MSALVAALLLAPAATAQTYTWDSLYSVGDWSPGFHWQTGVPPSNNTSAVLRFPNTPDLAYTCYQNIADPFNFQGIVCDANSLTLSLSGISLASVQTNTGAVTLNTAIVGANGTGTLTCSSTGSTPITLNGALTGAFGLNVASGTTVLGSGANTYSVGTTVTSATLRLSNGTALPTGGAVTVTGGTLDIGTLSNGSGTAIGSLNLLSGGKLQVGASAGDYHLASLNLDGGAVTDGGASTIFWLHLRSSTGIITGTSSGLTSTISLAGSSRVQNDSSGAMTFSVANGNTANGIDLDIGAIVSGGGAGGANFVKSGAGTLRLTNTNNSASFTVNQGLLRVDSSAALGSGQLTLNGGGLQYGGSASATVSAAVPLTATSTIEVTNAAATLTLTGNNTYNSNYNNYSAGLIKTGQGSLVITNPASTPTFGSTTVAGGSLTMNASPGAVNLQAGSLSLVGNSPLTASLSGAAGTTLTLSANVLLQDTNTTPATFAGSIAGAGGLFVGSGGTVTTRMVLSGVNTFTGGLTVGGASYSGGTVALGATNALAPTGAVVVQGGSTLDLTNAGVSYSQTVGSLSLGAGSAVNLGSATLTFGDATNKTLAGTVTGAGGALVKTGSGTLTLSGTNTYTGGTTVVAGTVSVAADANLGGQSGPVSVLNAGQLVLTGTSFTTSRQFNLGVSTLSPAAGGSITFSGATVTGGTLTGTLVTTSGLGSTFIGVATAPSATLNLGGADGLVNSNLGGATTVLASGYTPALTRTTNTTSGRLTANSTAQLSVADFVNNGTVTLADAPAPASRTTLTNTGTSDLYFGGGSRTFVGTAANAPPPGHPELSVSGVNLNGKAAVVAGGLFVNNGYVGNGQVIADYGAVVKGGGIYSVTPLTRNGGAFQAGNSPGAATVGSFDFNGGGQFNFQINNAGGVAGPTPNAQNQVSGWSLIRSQAFVDPFNPQNTTTGSLSVSATSSSKFTLKLQTLQNPSTVGQDNFGLMANFSPPPTTPVTWTFLTYEGIYSGPADLNSVIAIDASQFQNPTNGGTFSVTLDIVAHTVGLTFTPVPEPAVTLLVGVIGLAGYAVRRRAARWSTSSSVV